MADLRSSPAAPPHYTEPRATGTAALNVGGTERVLSTLGGVALAAIGLARRSPLGWLMAGLGGVLVYRGASGHCPAFAALGVSTADDRAPDVAPVEVVESVTVAVPRAETYAFWRTLENLPRFMRHLRRVTDLGGGRSRWEAKGPGPFPDVVWESEIVVEEPGAVLAWRSLPGADVDNAGHVRFTDAPSGGTEVHVRIGYRPPAGAIGAAVARWLDPVLGQMVKEDVRRFKHVLETGEVPTTEGQPSGRED